MKWTIFVSNWRTGEICKELIVEADSPKTAREVASGMITHYLLSGRFISGVFPQGRVKRCNGSEQ